jgi:hypothetical protein
MIKRRGKMDGEGEELLNGRRRRHGQGDGGSGQCLSWRLSLLAGGAPPPPLLLERRASYSVRAGTRKGRGGGSNCCVSMPFFLVHPEAKATAAALWKKKGEESV